MQSVAEQELAEEELRILKKTMECKILDLEEKSDQLETLSEIAAQKACIQEDVKGIEARIATTEAQIAHQKALIQKANEDIRASVDRIVPVKEIEAIRKEMKKWWDKGQTAKNRTYFDDAQGRMIDVRARLNMAGFSSQQVDLAVDANFNRRDRDRRDLDPTFEFETTESV